MDRWYVPVSRARFLVPLPHRSFPDGPFPSESFDGLEGASDNDLIVHIGRGDAAALPELMRRYRGQIVGYAASLLDADAAEDVAQETFLRVTAHAGRWRPLGSARTYLFHIARNIVLNTRRRRNRFAVLDAARTRWAGRSAPTPGELLDESELRAAIEHAINAMPGRRREVFGLIRFGGLSYREAASIMGTSPQTIANQMSAALADVRNAIEPFTDQLD
jgi:RNA polymerase sigma-70 factor (ECF subfamily)